MHKFGNDNNNKTNTKWSNMVKPRMEKERERERPNH